MTSANRTIVSLAREVTQGTTPTTPRMRTMRITGESLNFAPDYIDSDELRADRMLGDPIKVMQASTGGVNFELSYPDPDSPLSVLFESACFNPWVNTPTRFNDGTADSVITGVATSGTVVTVTTGAAFVAGQLVRFTGFGVANNNGVFKCTTGSATVPAFVGSGITDEAAPPAAARMKVVGFIGASADINATSTGLSSTALNFTTLGLVVGQWVKIGGTAAGTKFVTTALNDWVRITAITATALTFDNRPSGWTTETGTSITLKVWFGDQIRNGITPLSMTIEKGFLGQTTPAYIVNTGMEVNEFTLDITSRQKITGSFSFVGMGGDATTTALDASPDAVTTGLVMAANANVGRLGVDGSQLVGPNWARSLKLSINNNLRTIESVDATSPVAVREGECTVTGSVETYFGSLGELTKFYNNTATSFNARVQKTTSSVQQALIFQLPHAQYRGGGNPTATAKNTDVMASFDLTASQDAALTLVSFVLDRVEYLE